MDDLSSSTKSEISVSSIFFDFIEFEEFSRGSLLIAESIFFLSLLIISSEFLVSSEVFEKIFFSLSGFQFNSITIKHRKKNDSKIIRPIFPIKSTIIELIS